MFWCVKCAKYLAFDTFERPDDSALRAHISKIQNKMITLLIWTQICLYHHIVIAIPLRESHVHQDLGELMC